MVAATLKLGIAILNGGNSTVQQVKFIYFLPVLVTIELHTMVLIIVMNYVIRLFLKCYLYS